MSGLELAAVAFGSVASRLLRLLRSGQQGSDKQSTPFGIQILPDGPENPVADICFVHGLSGDSVSTWLATHSGGKGGFWWPEDLQKISNARVMLYRYSNMAPTAEYLAQRTLYHQAEYLVQSLAEAREDHPRRPLILVAHSLGGIIVKSALIFSSQSLEESGRTRAIVLSTAGIVFFGTPHRLHNYHGPYDGILQRIARSNGLNQKVLQHLDNESKTLQSHLNSFAALSTDIAMASFFEMRITSPIGGLVVPRSEIGPIQELSSYYQLDSNHANLAKFDSPEDDGYVFVLSIIKELCEKARSRVDDKWKACEQGQELRRVELNIHKNKNRNKRLDDFRVPFQLPTQSWRFIGREDALEWIEDSILGKCPANCSTNCQTVNLHGPGGIGKTQIALAFANRFRDRFSSVFWIPSDTRTAVEHRFLEIARALRLPVLEAGDEILALETVLSVLEWLGDAQNVNWLLIFDNVNLSASDIVDLIPSTTCVHGHVMATSREPLKIPYAKKYEVDLLRREESRALLRVYLGSSDTNDSDLDMMAETMNGHPLALSMSAEAMKRMKMSSPRKFLEEINERMTSPIGLRDQTINKTLAVSFDKISEPSTRLLLCMCCLLSLDMIPLWFFGEVSSTLSSKRTLRESLSTLKSYALVLQRPSQTHVMVHRLVRDYGRRELPEDLQFEASRELCGTVSYIALAIKQGEAILPGIADKGAADSEQEFLELARDALSLMERHKTSSLEWKVNLEELGNFCRTHGRLSEATKFYEFHMEKTEGPDASISWTKIKLALTRRRTGESLEASVSSEKKSLSAQFQEVVDAAPDDNYLRVLKSLNREQDDPEQELEVLRMIIEMQEKRTGPMNLSMLESAQELSSRLIERGSLSEAESVLRRVLVSCQKLLRPHHPSAARVAEQLASVCVSLGKLDEAEVIYQDTTRDYEMRLGPDHVSTQGCLAQLAFTYSLQGRYEEADRLFVTAIPTMAATLGYDHPDVLRVECNHAINLSNLGRKQESQLLLKDALSRTEAHPEIHPASTRQSIAIQLLQKIKGDSTIREGDELWRLATHLEETYDFEQ